MKFKKIFILLAIMLFFTKSYAQDTNLEKNSKAWYVPDYTKIQFAGNIGFVSLGVGYQLFHKVLYSELLYGYVPKSVSKADRIHLLTIKNTFPIYRKKLSETLTITPIAGFTTSYEIGTNSFTSLPSVYPDGYYVPNAFHFTLFGGGLIHKDFKKKNIFSGADLYVELGTVETYLWYTITSSEVKVNDVFSASFGFNFYF